LTETDVLIVGGGPAGSSLARALVAAGIDVTVLDRAAFPRNKVCAGWITPAVVQALDLDLDDYARGQVLQAIHGFRVGVISGRSVTASGDANSITTCCRVAERVCAWVNRYERSAATVMVGRSITICERGSSSERGVTSARWRGCSERDPAAARRRCSRKRSNSR